MMGIKKKPKNDFLLRLLEVIWPSFCAACRVRSLSLKRLCESCEASVTKVNPGCTICGRPFESQSASPHPCGKCVLEPPAFDSHRSLVFYEEPVKTLLHRYKFKGDAALAGLFAGWLGQEELRGDFLIPVPLHASRLRMRLFNQSLEWALILSTLSGIPVLRRALFKTKKTAPQTRLDQKERALNLAHAFEWKGRSLEGKTIVLVDDVFTTGATLSACAKALRPHGPAAITAVTIAYNPKRV